MTFVRRAPAKTSSRLAGEVVGSQSLVGHVRLDEGLAPRRDRRSHRADDRQPVDGRGRELGDHEAPRGVPPVRPGQERGDDVCARDEDPDPHEQVLHAAVAAEGDEADDDDRGDGRADLGRHAEEAERRPDPGELGDRRSQVRGEHDDGRERAPAHAPALADQAHQPLARGEPEAGAHLLREEQDDLAREDHPQERVAELGPDDRVGRDAARVVVGEAADEARPEDGKDGDEADPPGGNAGDAAEGPEPARPVAAAASLLVYRLNTRGSRFFHAVGMIVSSASSTVTIPTSRPSSSTTGTASRL